MGRFIGLWMVLVAVCAGCGTNISKANVSNLKLAQTSGAELETMFGHPKWSETRSDSNGRSSELRRYDAASGSTFVAYRTVDYRWLMAELQNGRLHAFTYICKAGKDTTRIDDAAVKSIVVGRSGRDDVMKLLGEPAGRALPGSQLDDYEKLFDAGVSEIWAWSTFEGLDGWMWSDNMQARLLFVKFGADGKVLGTATKQTKM